MNKKQIFILIISILFTLPIGLNAQNQKIKLSGNNISLKTAFDQIEKQTGLSVDYDSKVINIKKLITPPSQALFLDELMVHLLKDTQCSYKINKSHIIINYLSEEAKREDSENKLSLKKITGTVIDTKGEPIIGASVVLKGSNTGTITNVNGEFSLDAQEQSEILISYVGHIKTVLNVNKSDNYKIVLEEDTQLLDEVVVVGYGVQRKSDLTGAVSQIKMNSLESKEAISLADFLRGSIAGLNINRSASIRGQSEFEIRGQTSLGTSTAPLIVVNGMIFSGLLNDINPNDIESVSVMKDASSAAVYGASAASGVIIITTKQGTTDKPIIKLDLKTSVSQLFRKQDSYDVEGYLKMRGDMLITEKVANYDKPDYFTNPYKLTNTDSSTWLGYDTGINPLSDPTEVWLNRLKLYPQEKQNYYNYNSIDWVDRVFRPGMMQDYNFSVSGKSKNLNYYWSLGSLNNKGIVVNDHYKNIRSNINVNATITNFLEAGIKANLSTTNADGTPVDWSVAYNNSPLGDFMNDDGTYVRYPNSDNMGRNPFDKTQWDTKERNLNLMGILYAKLKLPFGVTFETNYNNRWRINNSYYYKPSWTIDGSGSHGVAQRQEYGQYEWSIENLLKWQKSFNDIHKFDLTLLQSAAKFSSNSTTATASTFNTSEVLDYHLLDLGSVQTSSSNDQVDTKASLMGRLNYTLMEKYLLALTFRRDGYSAFGQMNPWANFPAIALGWRVSEESFMKKINWISNLKLRASYGKNGNSNIGRYSALSQLSQGYYISDGLSIITLYPSTMANQQLKWEQTLSTNFGVDLGLFDNRLNLTIEAYDMNTTNMLMNRALPTLTGYSTVKSNLGEVNNKGIEVTVNTYNIKQPKFKWSTDFVFSMNRNTIKHLYGNMVDVLDDTGNVIGQKEADDPTNGWYIGHSIDEIYGYEIIGIWQTNEVEQALTQGRIPGDYKTYMDPNHTKLSSADYQWQGHLKPQFRMSMRNNINFLESFNFSFLIRSDFNFVKANNEINVGGYADRISQMKFPYWTESNPSNYWGRLGAQRTGNIYRNASFLRIEDASLNYAFPKKLMNKISIQEAKVFMNVDNVYSFDTWLYWDPETKAPTPTTFTLGLSLTL